jgi:uncharacterized protein YegP (UPF0339 family)
MHNNTPKFELFKAQNSQWSWRLKASNHLSIAYAGETYHNKGDARHGIDLVKQYAALAPFNGYKFEFFVAQNGQHAWRFIAPNGRSIAWSGETYHNKADAEHAMQLVKKHAASAPIFEPTDA